MTTLAWRQKNPESHRTSSQRWREKNRAAHQAYSRAYYLEHREEHLAYRKLRYQRCKAILDRFKTFKGCARCGYRDNAAALNFHHRDPSDKSGAPSAFLRQGMAAAKRELAKCDVLCANCHAITHAEARA